MEMIERYLYAICKNLPAKSRKDIEEELRSSIMDAIEARTGSNPPTDEDIAAVLKEFGAPKKVALNYTKSGSYLIGPELYDIYIRVLKIMMALALIGTAIGFIAETAKNGTTPIDFANFIGELFSAVFSAVGSITIIFAIIERVNPDLGMNITKRNKEWNPKDLPPVPKTYEYVKFSEVIVGMVFTVLFFMILNYFPSIFSAYFHAGNPNTMISIPVNFSVLQPFMPYINILLCLSFIKYTFLLIQGRHKTRTFILEIIGGLGALAVVAFLIYSPSVIDLSGLDSSVVNIGNVQNLKDILVAVFRGILALCGVFVVIGLVKNSMKFIRYLSNRT